MLIRTAYAGAVAAVLRIRMKGERVLPRSIRRGPTDRRPASAVLRRAQPSIVVAISAISQKVIEERKPMTKAFGTARA
jgi:hypothetical protein